MIREREQVGGGRDVERWQVLASAVPWVRGKVTGNPGQETEEGIKGSISNEIQGGLRNQVHQVSTITQWELT